MRGRQLLFHLDFPDSLSLRYHCIEKFRVFDRKQQKGQRTIRQRAERLLGKPDGIGKSNHYRLGQANDTARPENRIAEAFGIWLNHVGDLNTAIAIAEIFEDVGFARRNHEAYLVGAAQDQTLDQILRDRARALAPLLRPAADRQQFFRKCQWLNSAAAPGGRGQPPQLTPPLKQEDRVRPEPEFRPVATIDLPACGNCVLRARALAPDAPFSSTPAHRSL